MAGDWIKMRTDLYRDPKVCVIADILLGSGSELARYVNQNIQRDMAVTRNVMRNVTVGALVSVWGVLRHRGKRIDDDLVVKGCGLCVVDDLAELPGFGAAMASVGWIQEGEQGIVFPRFFEEFNVDPSEELRQKNAERQRRWREKNKPESNVTVASQSNAREEKNREEVKERERRGTRLPKDFDPTPEPEAEAGIDRAKELANFRDWWAAKPGKDGLKLDWQATWRTWARKAHRNPADVVRITVPGRQGPDPALEKMHADAAAATAPPAQVRELVQRLKTGVH